jgi:2-oxo-3-hexenedioate decarboxylase
MPSAAAATDTARLAEQLRAAVASGTAVVQPPVEPTPEEAYAVQARLLAMAEQTGSRLAGAKLGFTSLAKMAQMGVDSVIAGFLLDQLQVPSGGRLDPTGLIHPRVEPEVAFRISRDVPATAGAEQLISAVDAVAPALEVIDSRYRDFRFRLGDVIADNTSAARYVVGPWQPVPDALSDLAVTMTFDGVTASTGSTAAILGDPWEALRALAALPHTAHLGIPAGGVVLAGAATEAVALPDNVRVQAHVAGLGSVELVVGGSA